MRNYIYTIRGTYIGQQQTWYRHIYDIQFDQIQTQTLRVYLSFQSPYWSKLTYLVYTPWADLVFSFSSHENTAFVYLNNKIIKSLNCL